MFRMSHKQNFMLISTTKKATRKECSFLLKVPKKKNPWKAGISSRHVQAPSPSGKIPPPGSNPKKARFGFGAPGTFQGRELLHEPRSQGDFPNWSGSIPKWWWKSKGMNIPQNEAKKKHSGLGIILSGFFPYPRNQSSPPGIITHFLGFGIPTEAFICHDCILSGGGSKACRFFFDEKERPRDQEKSAYYAMLVTI